MRKLKHWERCRALANACYRADRVWRKRQARRNPAAPMARARRVTLANAWLRTDRAMLRSA